MRNKIIVVIIIILLAFIGYNYLYQDHRNIAKEVADYNLTAKEISSEFVENQNDSEKKYIDKTLIISGLISEINQKNVTLEGVVFCTLISDEPQDKKEKLKIKIKGRCIGYDDLFQQVKLDQCSILDN